MQKVFIFERGAGCGGYVSGGVPVTAHRHVTGTRSKSECRFEGPKAALRRHLGGTPRSPHDLVIDAEKDSLL
eukprot:5683516-Prymnesium_polylepis.1